MTKGVFLGRASAMAAAILLAGCAASDDEVTGEANGGASASSGAEFAYIPLQGSSEVVVVDLATMAEVGRVPTDGRSIDTRITPDYSKVYVINVFNPNVSVIRARCPEDQALWNQSERDAGECVPNSRLESITVDDEGAYYFSLSEDGSRMYLVSDSGINIIDTRTDEILRKISPEGFNIANETDPDGTTLWLGGAGGLMQAINIESAEPTGRTVQVEAAPATFKLTTDGKWMYTVNIPTNPDAEGMSVNTDGQAVIQAVNLETMEVVATQQVGQGTFILGLEVSTDGSQIWSANGNNTISLMDGTTHALVTTITTDFDAAEAVELTPDGELLLAVGHMGALDPTDPPANAQAYAQFYSTETFEKVGEAINLGETSGGIPVISPH